MKKILLVVFLLASVIADSRAQRVNFDSLKRVLAKKSASDTSRVTTILQLQDVYSEYKPDSSIYYAKQLIEWATKHNDAKLLAEAREGIAFCLYIKGDYAGALDMAFLGLPYIQTSKDVVNLANTYNLIGNIYKGQENYPKAISYYRVCLQKAAAAGDTVNMSYATFNLGEVFTLTNVIDSAIYYLKKAAVYDHVNHGQYKDVVLDLWGDIYAKSKDYKRAIIYLQQSYTLAKKVSDFRTQAMSCISLSNYYKQLNNADSVIYWAKEGLKAARIVSTQKIIYQSADLLSSAYGSKHQTDSALKYLTLSSTTKDSLYSTSKFQAIDALNTAEARRNAAIADAQAAYQNNLRIYLLFFVIGVILLVVFFLWRNSRNQKIANEQLSGQNEKILAQRDEIRETLDRLQSTQTQLIQSEKMASLGELTAGIAHEIQNPLNFVNNFSEVNKELLVELKEEIAKGNLAEISAIADDLIGNEEKINHHGKRADFIVKGMLQHSRTSTGEKQLTNINVLTDEFLKLSYHGLRAKDKLFNAELVTHFDENLPKVNIAQQDIGRVLLNLFNNAFYAVNQKQKTAGADYKPEVVISTSAEKNNLIIKVKDNGNGIPENIKDKIMQPFFTTKPTGEGTGLGLSLSYDIVVKGHGGSITVDTKENEFTEFTVWLPIA